MDSAHSWPAAWRFALSAGGVALATAALIPLRGDLPQGDVSLLYLLVVLISATVLGLGPAILASLLAFLAFNFFFVPPLHTFAVAEPRDVLRLVTFLIVAIIASSLAGHAQRQADAARRRTAELAALYDLSQTISTEVALERILPTIAQATIQLINVPTCAILLYDENGRLVERASAGGAVGVAKRVDIFLRVGQRVLGVLRVTQRSARESPTAAEQDRLQTIAAQVLLVLERARLAEEAGQARILAESDRLKSALLSSVSHDLRTPLAVIKGAATNLLQEDVEWDAAARRDFLLTIDEEADRLNRLVGNLLDMSRIEAGALHPTRNWQDLGELIGNVINRLQSHLADHPVAVDVSPDLPLILVNYTQIEQVLTNLLENAAKYTPPETPISIRASIENEHIQIEVLDRGPGIPEGMGGRIFDKFFRAIGPERHADGSGLGLAICKGIVEAHGGHIWAENQPAGGARFVFTIPLHPTPERAFAMGTDAVRAREDHR